MNKYNIAIVGASGLVGRKMLEVLIERNFPINNITLLASERSAGQKIKYRDIELTIETLSNDSFKNSDIALFSAGSYVSETYAPIAARSGCTVIDNGSFWRMNPDVPLIVPEVNPLAIKKHKGIIANPNCSTIQMVVALNPIYRKFGINRIICSTYQSISGAGQKGVDKLMNELKTDISKIEYPIAFNTLFHPVTNDSSDFTQEEEKMRNETRKILEDENIKIAVTCVRLPILGGHSENVIVETKQKFEIENIRQLLSNSDGITVIDNIREGKYATPQIASDKDDVFVSRIRKDDSAENSLYLWVTSDNLRKGAATNAVQIAELLI